MCAMDEQIDKSRIPWTTRINLRPLAREAIQALAKSERISVATMVGLAIETFITARST